MDITFLSHPIDSNTPSYGNRDKVIINPKSKIANGQTSNTSEITFTNNHIGTHVDVPKHFYEHGKTISDLSPSEWVFENIELIDVPCDEARLIELIDFEGVFINKNVDFLIIRTGFEKKRNQDDYWKAYPGITSSLCEYFRSNYPKLRAIGFDFISLTSPLFKSEGVAAHRTLLKEIDEKFVLIVEDMKIAHLAMVPSSLIVSPIIISDGNGGPVTIFSYQ